MAEKLVALVPTLCKFNDNGCSMAMPLRKRLGHEQICTFRDVLCPYCIKTITFSGMLDHVDTRHYDVGLKGSRICDFFEVEDDTLSASWSYDLGRMFCRNQHFFAVMHRDQSTKMWYMWVYILGTREDAKKYYYKINIVDEPNMLAFCGNVISIDETAETVINSLGEKLSFNDKTAYNFYSPYMGLWINIKVTEEASMFKV